MYSAIALAGFFGLNGFGVQPNPHAPSASEVMKYAPAEIDYLVHIDLEAVLPHSYQALIDLSGSPELAGTDLGDAIGDVSNRAEIARNAIKMVAGFDPVTDVKSITVFVTLGEEMPQLVGVVRGKFDKQTIDGLAARVPPPLTIGLSPDGSLLIGSSGAIEKRLTAGWKPTHPDSASTAARARELLAGRPFFVLVSGPSARARAVLERELGARDNALRDLATGHELAAVVLHHNRLSWTVTARDRRGYRRALEASTGILELLRASHYATRGLARLFFASLESYQHIPELKKALEHEDELKKLVFDVTGDGKFRARVRRRAARKTVSITATGKKLSDVVPVGALMPLVSAGVFLVASRRDAAEARAAAAAAEARRSSTRRPRLRVRERYRQLRARHPRLVEIANGR